MNLAQLIMLLNVMRKGIKKLLDVTRGGADAVLECVGSKLSMQLLLVAY